MHNFTKSTTPWVCKWNEMTNYYFSHTTSCFPAGIHEKSRNRPDERPKNRKKKKQSHITTLLVENYVRSTPYRLMWCVDAVSAPHVRGILNNHAQFLQPALDWPLHFSVHTEAAAGRRGEMKRTALNVRFWKYYGVDRVNIEHSTLVSDWPFICPNLCHKQAAIDEHLTASCRGGSFN